MVLGGGRRPLEERVCSQAYPLRQLAKLRAGEGGKFIRPLKKWMNRV